MSKTINTKKTKPIKHNPFPAEPSPRKLYTFTLIGLGGEAALMMCFQRKVIELKSQDDVVVENALFHCSKTKEYEVAPRHTLITEDSSTQLLKKRNAIKNTLIF